MQKNKYILQYMYPSLDVCSVRISD